MSQALERHDTKSETSELVESQQQLKFLALVMDRAKDKPELMGFLQVIAKEFGEMQR